MKNKVENWVHLPRGEGSPLIGKTYVLVCVSYRCNDNIFVDIKPTADGVL